MKSKKNSGDDRQDEKIFTMYTIGNHAIDGKQRQILAYLLLLFVVFKNIQRDEDLINFLINRQIISHHSSNLNFMTRKNL